ncbi:PP2C family protein-serine/threonine phosphatase [Deinococcus lacus]|uniref:PP2C family protein-serine/threonine phosphatase n=1 Tax=Deinococcus lacus TaxID=392561 RepID=A0ABW1YFR3_9DEIO
MGRQRQGSINQDAVLEVPLPRGRLYAVADGMGGHAAGELAANLALSAFSKHLLDTQGNLTRRLIEAAQAANRSVVRHAVGEYVGMGTTLLAAVVDGGTLLLVHVGDSRAYLLRGGVLYPLTDDHSWVAEQVRQGLLTEEEGRRHQWRNVVSNALGGEERVRLEVLGLGLHPGDRLLLCTDGLVSVVSETKLLTLLSSGSAELTARLLVDMANQAGGPDNVSVVVVDVTGNCAHPHQVLPTRRPEGPLYAEQLLELQRRSSPLTYLFYW